MRVFPAWARHLSLGDVEIRGIDFEPHAEPARYGHPRAVVLSNYGHGTVRARCHACGVEHFFDKSFQMDELLDFVQAQAARH